MISGSTAQVRVLTRKKQDYVSPRILDLRIKIKDAAYLDNAVQRIAQVISRKLIENPEDDKIFGEGDKFTF